MDAGMVTLLFLAAIAWVTWFRMVREDNRGDN